MKPTKTKSNRQVQPSGQTSYDSFLLSLLLIFHQRRLLSPEECHQLYLGGIFWEKETKQWSCVLEDNIQALLWVMHLQRALFSPRRLKATKSNKLISSALVNISACFYSCKQSLCLHNMLSLRLIFNSLSYFKFLNNIHTYRNLMAGTFTCNAAAGYDEFYKHENTFCISFTLKVKKCNIMGPWRSVRRHSGKITERNTNASRKWSRLKDRKTFLTKSPTVMQRASH